MRTFKDANMGSHIQLCTLAQLSGVPVKSMHPLELCFVYFTVEYHVAWASPAAQR